MVSAHLACAFSVSSFSSSPSGRSPKLPPLLHRPPPPPHHLNHLVEKKKERKQFLLKCIATHQFECFFTCAKWTLLLHACLRATLLRYFFLPTSPPSLSLSLSLSLSFCLYNHTLSFFSLQDPLSLSLSLPLPLLPISPSPPLSVTQDKAKFLALTQSSPSTRSLRSSAICFW